MKFYRLLLSVVCLVNVLYPASSPPVRAESPNAAPSLRWRFNGPFGGTVRSLAQDPQKPERFLLGTHDGQLYRSTDGARSWVWLPSFNRPGHILDNLLVDPRDSETVYLSMWSLADDRDGGVFKSTDGGKSWKAVFEDHSVRALTMHRDDSDYLVAGALDGVFRSTDAGKHWKLISPPDHPEIRNIESVAIDPRDAQVVYAGTWHLPWKTLDGGKTWFSVKGDATKILDDSDIFSITIDQGVPDRVFSSACSGIYRSLDAGKNWTKFQGIPYSSRRTHLIYQHPTRSDTIFACTTEGLWRTLDGGTAWKMVTPRQTVINAMQIDPRQPDRVVIGTENGGVLISENGGDSFFPSNDGFVTRQVSSIVVDPMQRGRVFASVLYNGPEGGVYVSNDNGQTWQPSSSGLGVADVYSLFVMPENTKTLYAATNTGVFVSENSGASWTKAEMRKTVPKSLPKKKGLTAKPTAAKPKQAVKPSPGPVAAVPKAQDLTGHVMEIVAASDGRGLVAASWDGLFRTVDPKRGWEKIPVTGYLGRVFSVAVTPREPDLILIGVSDGLMASRDRGTTWERIQIDKRDGSFVQEIAVNPRDPNMVLVGTRRALYVTRDGMRTWERLGRGVPYGDIAAIRFNPRNPDEILVGEVGDGGLYISRDGGRRFQHLEPNTPSRRVWATAFDLFEENRVYVGSYSSGVLVGSPIVGQ